MASILIVSGSPGTGKTTVSAALANAAPHGLHLASDSFYRFPVRLVDPTTRVQAPLLGSLLHMMAVTTFFLVNGHHLLVRGFAASLARSTRTISGRSGEWSGADGAVSSERSPFSIILPQFGHFKSRPTMRVLQTLQFMRSPSPPPYRPTAGPPQGRSPRNRMPLLDQRFAQNVGYATFFTHNRRTNRGLYALLCGELPSLPSGIAKMTVAASAPWQRCLPEIAQYAPFAVEQMIVGDRG